MKSKLDISKIIFLLLLLSGIGKMDAQQKRMLKPEDYKLWSTLYNGVITDDGRWVSYRISHQDGKDTLYLKNVVTDKKYSYPSATLADFSPDSKWFACIRGDSLQVLGLHTGERYFFPGITGFSFASGGRYLLGYSNNKNTANGMLWFRDLKTSEMHSIENVREYILNPERTILGIVTEEKGIGTVRTMALKAGFPAKVLASGTGSGYSGLVWNKPGTALAFYSQLTEGQVQPVTGAYLCRTGGDRPLVKVLEPLRVIGFRQGRNIEATRPLYVSDDGRQLFFYIHKPEGDNTITAAEDKNAVQIWRPDDKKVPPPAKQEPLDLQWCVWWADRGRIVAVEDEEYPNVVLTGDQKKALVYRTGDYLPQHDYVGDYIDLYIKDLITGSKKLLVKKQLNEYRHTLISPAGKYVTYFKDRNWWVYDIGKDTHKCITAGLEFPFEDIGYDRAGIKPPYGNPGWLDDDSRLFVYDEFDIWLISPDGSIKERITDGRKTGTVYRIYDPGYYMLIKDSFYGFTTDAISANTGILIKTLGESTLRQGFCYWDRKSGLRPMLEKDRNLYLLSDKAEFGKPFLFLESDFDVPPRLVLLEPSGKELLVCQGNPQQKEFYWGKSELVKYTAEGKNLKGALLYPADYVPGRKYPIIVYIYEKEAGALHKYVPPSENLSDGFNPTNYTAEGYFVLYPDIAYELNNPGVSATHCVVALVEKVLEKGSVDRDRIGLMGISFGGYQTTFIISQTNLFRTAIAGAPVTDLVDSYLSIESNHQSNILRFENHQFRIQSPFYGDDFLRNSSIMHAQNINTPLLLYTGTEDPQVDWTQSRKLQIALWRLHKKSTLLVYPGEGHGFSVPANRKDITGRVKSWFDYYLKQAPAADWITE